MSELVLCVRHTFSPQRFCSETLRRGMDARELDLRTLLMGAPMGDPTEECGVVTQLNNHLLGMAKLLPSVYGENESCQQAVMELCVLVDMDDSKECVACKRAMLLYGLSAEAEIQCYWDRRVDGSSAVARDLSSRVLPFIIRRFVKQSCQTPEEFVILSILLSEMWAGETLGNYAPL
jgi:hypothetical protein